MCQPDRFPMGGGVRQAFDLNRDASDRGREGSAYFRAALSKTAACRIPRQRG